MNALRPTLVLLLATLAFAAVVPGGGFVFDDHVLIERNDELKRGDVWWKAFERDYYATSDRPGISGYYRPIAVLCNAFDVHVWHAHARGAHLTNIALHVLACLLIPWALMALGVPAAAAWPSALVFAVHPVHAESVAFISGRVDVLAAGFIMLAMSFAASKARWAWLGVGFATLLAFLSKEIAVVLPVLLILVWRARASAWPKAQIAAVVLAGGVTILLRQRALDALLPTSASAVRPEGAALLPLQTLLFVAQSMFAPARLLSMEPDASRLLALRALAGALVWLGTWSAAWRWSAATRPALRRCAIAAGVSLFPILNVLPQETQLSERFLYLASVFLLVPIGLLVARAWSSSNTGRWAALSGLVLVIAALLWISDWRARIWRRDLSLWQHAVLEEPDRSAYWDRLGMSYLERRQWNEAENALRRAVQLDSKSYNAWHNLGVLLANTRRYQESADAYRNALQLHSRSVVSHVNLGRVLIAMRDIGAAYEEFVTATEIKPDYAEAHRLAGMAALRMGHSEDAERHLQTAARLDPANPSIQQTLRKLEQRQP